LVVAAASAAATSISYSRHGSSTNTASAAAGLPKEFVCDQELGSALVEAYSCCCEEAREGRVSCLSRLELVTSCLVSS
jgi:hypothetical protein